jgi:hypothetical protein
MKTMTFYDNTNNQEITYYLNEEGLVVGLEVFFFSPKDPSQIVATTSTPVQQQTSTTTRYPVTSSYRSPIYNSPPMPSLASGLNTSRAETIETIVTNAPTQVMSAPVYRRVDNPNRPAKRGCC